MFRDFGNVLDMEAVADTGITLGVDPLGGAGVHYWQPIAERYGLNLKVVNDVVDPTFPFMTLDWDGKIHVDPSSPYAMQSLIRLKDSFDVAFGCDTDHDRHGIVTKSGGLLPPNLTSPGCLHPLLVYPSSTVGQRRGGRKDSGQQQHDRSCRGQARAEAVRSSGRIQVFRGWAIARTSRLYGRGERRRLIPAS